MDKCRSGLLIPLSILLLEDVLFLCFMSKPGNGTARSQGVAMSLSFYGPATKFVLWDSTHHVFGLPAPAYWTMPIRDTRSIQTLGLETEGTFPSPPPIPGVSTCSDFFKGTAAAAPCSSSFAQSAVFQRSQS